MKGFAVGGFRGDEKDTELLMAATKISILLREQTLICIREAFLFCVYLNGGVVF